MHQRFNQTVKDLTELRFPIPAKVSFPR